MHASKLKNLTWFDWFRITAVVSFILVGIYADGLVATNFWLLAGFVFLHIILHWLGNQGDTEEEPEETSIKLNADGSDMEKLLRRTSITAKHILQDIQDRNASYRDVVKQYVATAGVVLGLTVAFASNKLNAVLLYSVVSLGLSMAFGLMLLELLTGELRGYAVAVVATLYHLSTWSLVYGIAGIVLFLYDQFRYIKEVPCTML